jgi:outer membrane biosynthesis protein TonB
MYSLNRSFKIAFSISILFHLVFLFLPGFKLLGAKSKNSQISVKYLKLALSLQKEAPRPKPKMIFPVIKPVLKEEPLKKAELPKVNKEEKAGEAQKIEKPAPAETEQAKANLPSEAKKQETVAIPKEVSTQEVPHYLDYYSIIRLQIRAKLSRSYQHFVAMGDVYLFFCLDREGRLLEAKVIDEKSNANNYLKKVALQSLLDAAPFPRFPEGLTLSQVTFSVIISFERE